MKNYLTEQELVEHVRGLFGWKGLIKLANSTGISKGMLSSLVSGKKKCGPETARKLGFEAVMFFKPIKRKPKPRNPRP